MSVLKYIIITIVLYFFICKHLKQGYRLKTKLNKYGRSNKGIGDYCLKKVPYSMLVTLHFLNNK